MKGIILEIILPRSCGQASINSVFSILRASNALKSRAILLLHGFSHNLTA